MDDKNQSDDSGVQPDSTPTVTDLINITIKTIDSKNYKFQVENNVSKSLEENIFRKNKLVIVTPFNIVISI